MRAKTQELRDALDNPQGLTTTQYLDVWRGDQFSDALDTFTDWSADNDAAAAPTWTLTNVGYGDRKYWLRTPAASDVNVTVTDNPGSIQLSAGTIFTAPTPSTYTAAAVHSYDATLQRIEFINTIYKTQGTEAKSYSGGSYRYTDEITRIPFLPIDDLLVDNFTLRVLKQFSSDSPINITTLFPLCQFFEVSIVDGSGALLSNVITESQAAGTTTHSIVGLNAWLRKGNTYYIQLKSFSPTLNDLVRTAEADTAVHNPYVYTTFYVHDLTGAVGWRVNFDASNGFDLGGQPGYQSSGTFYRSLDMGGDPQADGTFLVTDLTPSDSSITINLYHTTSAALFAAAGIAGWTPYGAVVDGDTITVPGTNDRYWRVAVTLNANTGQGETPVIERIELAFSQKPLVIGTHNEIADSGTGELTQASVQALDMATSSGSSMNPILSSSIDGMTKCIISPDPDVQDIINYPRGRKCRLRRGILGISETVTVAEGVLDEIQWDTNKYTLSFKDDTSIDDAAKMPRDKADVWDNATDYSINDVVAYVRKKYTCHTTPPVGLYPLPTDVTYWTDSGTVWIDILYTSGTHLVDIVKDILTNQLNIANRRIDFVSLEKVKALYPSRTIIKNKLIDSPISIKDSLTELAWLLESHWVKSNGKIALVPEPPTDVTPADFITVADIETLKYKRGLSKLRNTCIIQTDYEDGIAYDGSVSIDANSVIENDNNYYIYSFIDKWNMDTDEIALRAESYTTRNADGRRIIDIVGHLRLEALEVGTAVQVTADGMLPPGDKQTINMFVLSNNRDNSQIKAKLTLMEI